MTTTIIANVTRTVTIIVKAVGPQGTGSGGVPDGGDTGTALVKVDGTDQNTDWSTYVPGNLFHLGSAVTFRIPRFTSDLSVEDSGYTAADLLKMDNMVEGADAKILTAAERAAIAVIPPDAYKAITVADLSDPTTPSVLTTAETTNKALSNSGATTPHIVSMPAAHTLGNIPFHIGAAQTLEIAPLSGTKFWLNGVALAIDQSIINITGTIGGFPLVGQCITLGGVLSWAFFSSNSDWTEVT